MCDNDDDFTTLLTITRGFTKSDLRVIAELTELLSVFNFVSISMKAAPSVFLNKLFTAGCRSCAIWRRVVAELRTAVALSLRAFPLNNKLIYVF